MLFVKKEDYLTSKLLQGVKNTCTRFVLLRSDKQEGTKYSKVKYIFNERFQASFECR